jgi:chromosome partitioning protein
LAVEAVAAGRKVAIVDIDPQVTAAKWGDRREDKELPAVVSAEAARLSQVLKVKPPHDLLQPIGGDHLDGGKSRTACP